MAYEGYNGRITLEGDDLVVRRDGVKGRFGGDLERRIPLDDVEGAFLQPPPEPRRPGFLQLVLAGQPDEELTLAQAITSPDVVTFSAKQQPAFERLQDWLQNGGELAEEDGGDAPAPVSAPTAAAPSLSKTAPAPVAPPVAAPAAAPAPAPAAAAPFAPPPAASSGPGYGAGAPVPPMGLPDAVRSSLSKYLTFAGRARRSEYWWFQAALAIAFVVASIVDAITGVPVVTLVVSLGLFLPGLSVLVRRLHDVDRKGWWYFIALVRSSGRAWCLDPRDAEPARRHPLGTEPQAEPRGRASRLTPSAARSAERDQLPARRDLRRVAAGQHLGHAVAQVAHDDLDLAGRRPSTTRQTSGSTVSCAHGREVVAAEPAGRLAGEVLGGLRRQRQAAAAADAPGRQRPGLEGVDDRDDVVGLDPPEVEALGQHDEVGAKRSPPTWLHSQTCPGPAADSACATGRPRTAQQRSCRPCVQTRYSGASTTSQPSGVGRRREREQLVVVGDVPGPHLLRARAAVDGVDPAAGRRAARRAAGARAAAGPRRRGLLGQARATGGPSARRHATPAPRRRGARPAASARPGWRSRPAARRARGTSSRAGGRGHAPGSGAGRLRSCGDEHALAQQPPGEHQRVVAVEPADGEVGDGPGPAARGAAPASANAGRVSVPVGQRERRRVAAVDGAPPAAPRAGAARWPPSRTAAAAAWRAGAAAPAAPRGPADGRRRRASAGAGSASSQAAARAAGRGARRRAPSRGCDRQRVAERSSSRGERHARRSARRTRWSTAPRR